MPKWQTILLPKEFSPYRILRKYLQLLKRYTVTHSRCPHCRSAPDKRLTQTHGSLLLLPITPVCYLSSPTFLTPFHLFYTEALLCSRPRVYHPMVIHTQRQVRKTWKERRCCPLLMILLLNKTVVGGLPDISKQNLKLHFNTQPLSCHRNNTMRLT